MAARHPRTGGGSHPSPRHNDPLAENRSIAYLSFFDELRVFGFVERQNLKVDAGGYGLRDEQLPVHPPGADQKASSAGGP
jgi:hypothetical protein